MTSLVDNLKILHEDHTIRTSIFVFMILYGSKLAPPLSRNIVNTLNNNIVRFILVFALALASSKNPQTAFISVLVISVLVYILNNIKIQINTSEQFSPLNKIDELSINSCVCNGCNNIQLDKPKNEEIDESLDESVDEQIYQPIDNLLEQVEKVQDMDIIEEVIDEPLKMNIDSILNLNSDIINGVDFNESSYSNIKSSDGESSDGESSDGESSEESLSKKIETVNNVVKNDISELTDKLVAEVLDKKQKLEEQGENITKEIIDNLCTEVTNKYKNRLS